MVHGTRDLSMPSPGLTSEATPYVTSNLWFGATRRATPAPRHLKLDAEGGMPSQ